MSTGILEAIDDAIGDWETSRDAMRSRPGGFPSDPAELACWQASEVAGAGRLDIWADAPPSILLIEPGWVIEVNGKLYRVTGKTPGENGAVSFAIEPYQIDQAAGLAG